MNRKNICMAVGIPLSVALFCLALTAYPIAESSIYIWLSSPIDPAMAHFHERRAHRKWLIERQNKYKSDLARKHRQNRQAVVPPSLKTRCQKA